MTFKDKVVNLILENISEANKHVRQLENDSNKFSVVPTDNSVYIARVGYREALQDILSEIRSLNEIE